MKVSYSFPALTTALRRSASQPALRIVRGEATATVNEISADDAPIAAIVSVKDRDGGERIRFHEGRFYLNSWSSEIEPVLREMEAVAYRAIADALVDARGHSAPIHPKDMKRRLWNLWLAGRDNVSIPDSYRSSFISPGFSSELPLFNAEKHREETYDHWARFSETLLSEIVVIDGQVWRPIAEPLLNHYRSYHPEEWSYDDVGVFSMRLGRPTDLPPPYGKRQPLSNEGAWDSRYWRPGWKFVSLPEAAEIADERTGWLCEVNMPETFTTDVLSLEMDRAARLAVVAIRHAIDRSDKSAFIRYDEDLARHYKALNRLVGKTKAVASAGDIEDALSGFLSYTRETSGSPYHHGTRFTGRDGISEMMEDVLSRWSERPVSLDLAGNNAALSAGFRP